MNNIIYVQWTNNIGGLERITQNFEKIFAYHNPLVLPLRYNTAGICYINQQLLRTRNIKLLSYFEYLIFVFTHRKSIFHIQYAGTINLLLTFLAGARKIIFHFHGTRFSNNAFELFVWKILRNRIKIIANSVHTKNVINKKLNVERNISVIPNIIDTDEFAYSERKINSPFIITYAGRLSKGKNPELIIETAKYLQNTDVEIHIYGNGELSDVLKELIQSNHLDKIVKLHSYTNNIREVYCRSNLFIFLSRYESFGNVVAEALLTGLPVICSDLPSLREFVDDEIFFLKDQHPENIARRIIEIKNDYSIILEKTRIVSESIRQYLSKSGIINSLCGIYKELSENSK